MLLPIFFYGGIAMPEEIEIEISKERWEKMIENCTPDMCSNCTELNKCNDSKHIKKDSK